MRPAMIALLIAAPAAAAEEPRAVEPTPMGRIIRLDPRFDKLVPKGTKIEKIATGFIWSEGPLWLKDKKCLIFSDIPRNTIWKWSPAGGIEEFLKPSGYTGEPKFKGREPGSNGLISDGKGGLILCQHGDRQVMLIDSSGKREVLASKYNGKRLNSPNDAVMKSDGTIYFTDPPYGLPGNVKDPNKELPYQGVYRVDPKTKKVTLITKELSRPNGIALSPDGKTLYVANSDRERAIYMAYPVKPDGTVGKGRVFFDATKWAGKRPGSPDGMAVDAAGNLFATGPGGVHIFAPDGTHLGTLATGERTANCAFGGDDGMTLYMTADDHLARVKLTTRGLGCAEE